MGEVKVIEFAEFYFRSIKHYNQLLTSIEFYRKFSLYSHVCICQLDVLALNDELDYWMDQGWDYIGAPIFEGYSKAGTHSFKTSLNGGFSLRNVESAIKVLRSVKYRYSKLRDLISMEKSLYLKLVRIIRDGLFLNYNVPLLRMRLNEDLYWSYIVPRTNRWFRVPPPEVAQYFAFDNHPKWLFQNNGEKMPMAIHAWNRYDSEFSASLLRKMEIDSCNDLN